jgi:hypothetical protein
MTGAALTVLAVLVTGAAPQAPRAQELALAGEPVARAGAPVPIFHPGAPVMLELRLETDFDALLDDVGEERQYHEAILAWNDPAGHGSPLGLKVKTRGHFRRDPSNCDFPPLKLNFKKDETAGTPFAGQDKLKLVAHCRSNRGNAQQWVVGEYLTYRAYNLLTERSFRVQLVQVTYVDAAGRRDPLTRYGFLIEDDDAMAARNGCELIEVNAHPLEYSPVATATLTLFQYMIGHTDWSIYGMHNVKPMMCGEVYERHYYAVPYDFDFAGIIETPYATPDGGLSIRSVRERLYRGFCRPTEQVEAARQAFVAQKEMIYALFRDEAALDGDRRRRALDYLEEFYELLEQPAAFMKRIGKECRAAD